MTAMWNLYWEMYRKQVLTTCLYDPLDCQLTERTEPVSTLRRLQKKPGGLCASDKTTALQTTMQPPHHNYQDQFLWEGYSPVQCLMRPWPLLKKNIAALTLSLSIPLLLPNFFYTAGITSDIVCLFVLSLSCVYTRNTHSGV